MPRREKTLPSTSGNIGNILKLNVGGTTFQTTRSTLTKYDCMFRAMLESGIPVELDPAGCIFIDRDPTHFRLILNFMRDGKTKLPDSQKERDEILVEAEFYLLDGLINLCKNPPPADFIIVNEPTELLKILIEAEKEVLVYKVTTSQGMLDWPYDIKEFREFVEKYKERCQVVLMVVTNGCWSQWRLDNYPVKHRKDLYHILVVKSTKDLANQIKEKNAWTSTATSAATSSTTTTTVRSTPPTGS